MNINGGLDIPVIDTAATNIDIFEPIMLAYNNNIKRLIETNEIDSVPVAQKSIRLIMPVHSGNQFTEIVLTYGDVYYCTTNEPNHTFLNGDELIFTGFCLDVVPNDLVKIDDKNKHSNLKLTYRHALRFINKFDERVVYLPRSFMLRKQYSSGNDNFVIRTIDLYNSDYIKQLGDESVRTAIYQTGYYPVAPHNLITFHRSQGKTIPNVIVCIDDIFDLGMLYTGITRAVNDVKFYTRFGDSMKNKKDVCDLLFCVANVNAFLQLKIMIENVLTKDNGRKKRAENENKNKRKHK
jgi:hypothetical protein